MFAFAFALIVVGWSQADGAPDSRRTSAARDVPAAVVRDGPTTAPDLGESTIVVPRTISEVAGTGDTTVISEVSVASWYGPGMWGNRTACGVVLTDQLAGVAHRTLPCGAPVTLRHGSHTVTVPVVDRGPYVYSREFDLTYATKVALGCPDVCHLSWLSDAQLRPR